MRVSTICIISTILLTALGQGPRYNMLCKICNKAVAMVNSTLKTINGNNSMTKSLKENQIVAGLNAACMTDMFKSNRKECVYLMSVYQNQLKDELRTNITATCQTMEICTKKVTPSFQKLWEMN